MTVMPTIHGRRVVCQNPNCDVSIYSRTSEGNLRCNGCGWEYEASPDPDAASKQARDEWIPGHTP